MEKGNRLLVNTIVAATMCSIEKLKNRFLGLEVTTVTTSTIVPGVEGGCMFFTLVGLSLVYIGSGC